MRSVDFLGQALLAPFTTQWLQVAVVASLFLAALYRPEKIRWTGFYILAVISITVSIVLPPLVQMGLAITSATPSPTRQLNGWIAILLPLNGLFVGFAVLFGLLSVVPQRMMSQMRQVTPTPPRPHPLDD